MTLEVNGTLWASPNSDHFEIGFLMYPFYTDTRGWGLVNAMTADESNPIKNVIVTGTGTLYGTAGSMVPVQLYTKMVIHLTRVRILRLVIQQTLKTGVFQDMLEAVM